MTTIARHPLRWTFGALRVALVATGAIIATSAVAQTYGDPAGVYFAKERRVRQAAFEGPMLQRQQPVTTRVVVMDPTGAAPGTITVDTQSRFLYLSLADGRALRYTIGVGRAGFEWSGEAKIGRKAEWPSWRPPAEMLKRRPDLPKFMEGGPDNPLGARAMYLYAGNRDTMFRIHGSNEPDTIGQAVSSGCIRMLNEDVVDLYERVRVGTRVSVI